jgi:cell division protein FtsI/penicillin-binding protein 2
MLRKPPYYIKRLMWIRFLVALILPLFAYRLFIISVLGHQSYTKQAKNQYYISKEVPSERGEILAQDRRGDYYPLATNSIKFQIWVVPKNVKDKTETARLLAQELGLEEKEIFDQINNDKLYIPPLKRGLEWEQMNRIKELELKGVLIMPESIRFYPEAEMASHILGFVNYESQGVYGIEGYYNDQLTGYKGRIEAEKDNKGRIINVESQVRAQDGDSLILTIDYNIQFFAEQKIREAVDKYDAESGQLMVMDPKTGGILAMAAVPSYDPNRFNEEAKKDKEEGKDRFINPMVSYIYEPGSVIKPIVIAGGLEAGKIEPDTEAGPFSNMVVVQGYEIHTAQDKAFGRQTITQILQNSDNVAMVWVAEQLGNEVMYDNFEKFGFGKTLGIDMSGETTGKLLRLESWRDIHRATMAFGQGISLTPLQIVTAYSAIANDGQLMLPHLVDKIVRPDGRENVIENKVIGQPIKKETARVVKRMLQSVVEDGYGKKAKIEGYTLAGKTGTAQIAKPGGGYEEKGAIHSFVGFGPVEDPQFVILVKLDKPSAVEFAASSAAPTFRKMAEFLFSYLEIEKEE